MGSSSRAKNSRRVKNSRLVESPFKKSPLFKTTSEGSCKLRNFEGDIIRVMIHTEYKGFAPRDDGGTWECFRREFFSLKVQLGPQIRNRVPTFSFKDEHEQFDEFVVLITAIDDDNNPVEISHCQSHGKKEEVAAVNIQFNETASFDRIVFTKSTRNYSRKTQQYFRLVIEVFAILEQESAPTDVATQVSEKIVVLGQTLQYKRKSSTANSIFPIEYLPAFIVMADSTDQLITSSTFVRGMKLRLPEPSLSPELKASLEERISEAEDKCHFRLLSKDSPDGLEHEQYIRGATEEEADQYRTVLFPIHKHLAEPQEYFLVPVWHENPDGEEGYYWFRGEFYFGKN